MLLSQIIASLAVFSLVSLEILWFLFTGENND